MREVNVKNIAIYSNGKEYDIKTKVYHNGNFEDVSNMKFYAPDNLNITEIGAYTTWYADPSTSIMIHYQVIDIIPNTDNPVECLIKKESEFIWQTVELFADKEFPFTDRRVKWFKAEGLMPDTVYETKLKGSKNIHKFKTMPATHTRDIKVLATSDQMNSIPAFLAEAPQGFQTMLGNNIDVICIAGDAVHDDGNYTSGWFAFWDEYFKAMKNNCMIPIMCCFGNHDGTETPTTVLWHYGGATKDNVVYHYNFFSNLNDNGYGAVDIGEYLSILFLNSGHTVPVLGDQTTWLQNTLQAKQGRHIFPFFHVSPYPGFYAGYYSDEIVGIDMRAAWTPLFSQYGVKVVANGHEHVSLVTKRVTGNSLDANGVVYIGQGFGMGNITRGLGVTQDTWYVDYMSDTTKDFDVIEFKPDGNVVIKQLGLDGTVLYSKTV